MAWTLVSLAARASRALGGRRALLSLASAERAARLVAAAGDRPDVYARACMRRLERLGAADRRAVEVALDVMQGDAAVVERAMASGAPVDAVASLAAAWHDLDAGERALIRDPLGSREEGPVAWGAVTARQVDQTTCGAASMAMMLLVSDPFVAAWVAAGRRAGWYLPVEALEAAVGAEAASRAPQTVAERWDALQRALHARVTRGGLGLAPWPRALGTPPWRIDDATRLAGLRFRGALVDDARDDEVQAFAAQARAALADGIPVPLYVGGDSARGWSTVLPRHVVLLVASDGDAFVVYEPSSGALHRWKPGTAASARVKALGGWNRVEWAILPRPRA